jgi:hypothetical protein
MKATAKGASDFRPLPEGSHAGVCVRIIDLGTQETSYMGQPKKARKVSFYWEVPDERVEVDGEDKPAIFWNSYTFSVARSAILKKHAEAWLGRVLSAGELESGFDPKVLLGKACLLQVVHASAGGKTYANLSALMALPKGYPMPHPEGPLVYFSLEPDEYSPAIFEGFSDGLKAIIMKSPEWQGLQNGQKAPPSPQEARRGRSGDPDEGYGGDYGAGPGEALDDEIPF